MTELCHFALWVDAGTNVLVYGCTVDLSTVSSATRLTTRKMDSLSTSFLMAIPGFGGKAQTPTDLSPKDKRYLALVEKALSTFETLEEWADYIAFLSRLHKALQLPEDKPHSVLWIPLAEQVLGKLALCLTPQLPNGVHQKALSVYDAVFGALTVKALNKDISVWLPGLLPVISYGSMQVKPQLLSVYENHLMKNLEQTTMRSITKPFILSLLQGLDDENSEVFTKVLALLDAFKQKLADNSHFWQTLFLCIITSPEKRIGALNWCCARLPVFATIRLDTESKFSAEAQACLFPEPGLLVRAFATAVDTRTNFNQATDIIVIRGFFDLLLSHLPLSSEVIKSVVSPQDKELLIMACCNVTLKRDMSLNRRLWAWLLGPESNDETSDKVGKATYFETNVSAVLEKGLLSLVHSNDLLDKLKAFRISNALIMDRWEISQLVTPKLFVPIVNSCYRAFESGDPKSGELLLATKAFFDEVEAHYIWDYMTCTLIVGGSDYNLRILEFLLRNFNFPEDERSVHIPVAILCLLICVPIKDSSVEILEVLAEMSNPGLLAPIKSEDDSGELSEEEIISRVKYLYKDTPDEDVSTTINGSTLSSLLLQHLKKWFIRSISEGEFSERISAVLCEFLYSVAYEADAVSVTDSSLNEAVYAIPAFEWESREQPSVNLKTLFGIVKLSRFLVRSANAAGKGKILKIILSNLWQPLISSYPANSQVEAVRHIFDLKACFEVDQIEAGIVEMVLQTPDYTKIRAFYKLWTHSGDFSTVEDVLSCPLFIILDGLTNPDQKSRFEVDRFVHNVIIDGSSNRLLQLVTNPLLDFAFLQEETRELASYDDLNLFAYHLETIFNIIKSNEKLTKDALNHELVVSESTSKFDLIKNNNWDISNYKSLVLCVIKKFCGLKLSADLLESKSGLTSFLRCINNALEIYSILISGSESDFELLFRILIDACTHYILDIKVPVYEIELVEASYIKAISHFLTIAKSLNVDLIRSANLRHAKNLEDPLLVTFIVEGIKACLTSILLEKWFGLLNSCLYLLNESIFGVLLTLSDAIVGKIKDYLGQARAFDKVNDITDLESAVCILLSGLEDLLSISHSYLLTSNLRATSKAQSGENGFLGNVILGVFLIESPEVRTEEENKLYSVLLSLQDAAEIAFEIWYWADNKPQQTVVGGFWSIKSATHFANKLKFRSRKLLERLSDLERQEVIETIIATQYNTSTKLKILHVLDSGRSQITLPHILNSIATRCSPQALSSSNRSSMNSHVTTKQLSDFLVPYFDSIDSDTIDDIWEMSIQFFKDVLAHSSAYTKQLIAYLNVMKVLSLKSYPKRYGESRRNNKELAQLFSSVLNTAVSRKAQLAAEDAEIGTPDVDGSSEDKLADSLASLVQYFDQILQDSDKTNSAITTLISTLVIPQTKSKSKQVDISVVKLLEAIGKHHPNKAWKQVVFDIFMDNSFFTSKKCLQDEWRNVVKLWIATDKERMNELLTRVTPTIQTSAANIFIWNESSEVRDRSLALRRITFVMMILPKDHFATNLNELFLRLGSALNSDCPPLYKSEAFNLFRALSIKFSDAHLLPHWSFIIQSLGRVFVDLLSKSAPDFSSLPTEQLQLVLSACKLLDQLLLMDFDEFNLSAWLFVDSGSVVSEQGGTSWIDRLGKRTESLLTKEVPVPVSSPKGGALAKPILFGVQNISNVANLKRFFGLLSYIHYERNYGLCRADIEACEADTLNDLSVT